MIVNSSIQKLVNKYHEKRLAHAFLLVTNDISKCNKDIINLIKIISCKEQYTNNCEKCNLCYQIENDLIPNIIKIKPDGQWIKKDQILNLKESFKTKALYLENNIYIINEAEKLNSSSANTMLKFLEEPEENIIGFFVTTNKENIIETIKSRCQIIIANYQTENEEQILGINTEELNLIKEVAYKYLNGLISKKENGLILNIDLIKVNFDNRVSISKFFSYLFYKLNSYQILSSEDKFIFIKNLDYKKVKEIIKLVYEVLESITYNVNIDLILDKFVLEMEDIL